MRTLAAVIVLALLSAAGSVSQELSTSVYPSEDELLEALRLGEIDYYQYLILSEIIVDGLDSSKYHLLDEIPNLSHFLKAPTSLTTSLEKEQRATFSLPAADIRRLTAIVRYQYYQEVEQTEKTQYRASGRIHLSDRLEAAVRVHREYTGRERFVSRRLVYRSRTGPLRELALGNFSRRLGVGMIFGYRGKMLQFSDKLDAESFLFPDYGGCNGAYSRVKLNSVEAEALASISRDDRHHLVSTGGMVSLAKLPFRPGVIFGVSDLKNRHTGKRLKDIKYGLYSRYAYRDSYLSMELCGQVGEQSWWGGLVAEGRHHFGVAEIRYAGWTYADDFIDLTAGSKAGYLYRDAALETVDFSYRQKRAGQEGGMVKSIVVLSPGLDMVNSLLYAGRNADTADVQLLTGLVKRLSRECEVRLDYLNRTKKRMRSRVDQRTRAEVRIRTGNLSARGYIGYSTGTSKGDYASVFVNLKYRSRRFGTVEMWCNLARYDINKAAIDYWYIYLKTEQQLLQGVTTAAKLTHSYSRSGKHRTVILLELRTAL